jgi:TonB family protein
MQKIIYLIVLSMLFLHTNAAAKPDTLLLYLKNSEKVVKSKDSADFIRVILPPDTTVDKDLYRVFDYYMNGKRKSVATSLTGTVNSVLDGTCMNYFPNGRRKSTVQYKNGYIVGNITDYYPNGEIYEILKVEKNDNYYDNDNYYHGYANYFGGYSFKIIELCDSTGKILATNGTGHLLIFDHDFKTVIAEGNINNNKMDGEWNGPIPDTGRFTCIFHRGKLKSGISYTKWGEQYTFKEFHTDPVFDNGMDEFGYFIKRNLRYPGTEKRKVTGTVTVGFYVETDGTISDVKVTRSLIMSLDQEALRVVKQSPLWNPATEFGIPIRQHCKVDVGFFDY